MSSDTSSTRQGIHDELERVRADFHALVAAATPAELRRPSSGTRPFHLIDYQSDRGAARMVHGPRLLRWLDRTLDVLQAQLEAEPAAALARGMPMPVSWDPYFRDWMSLAEIYHYGTRHYDHHRQQLTLGRPS
ncbi:DinB family protein [Kocuria sp. CPCC 205292]|uniref:DinB family protein n=1 Tax=Kocuria cellulosilytica TaxID=3071451 RepID=UPI0034D3D1C9